MHPARRRAARHGHGHGAPLARVSRPYRRGPGPAAGERPLAGPGDRGACQGRRASAANATFRSSRAAQNGQCLACHKETAADVRQQTGLQAAFGSRPAGVPHGSQGTRRAYRCVRRGGFRPRRDRLRAARRPLEPENRLPQLPPAGKEVSRSPRPLHRLPREKGRAQGTPRQRVRGLPHRERLEGNQGRPRQDAVSAPRQARAAQVRELPQGHPLQGDTNRMHRLPPPGRQAQGALRRQVRVLPWRPGLEVARFDHDTTRATRSRGRHRAITCESCHAGHLYRDKLQTACIACHRKDDSHKGTLGDACGIATTSATGRKRSFDHGKTRFPLRGRHDAIECKSCHKSAVFKETPTRVHRVPPQGRQAQGRARRVMRQLPCGARLEANDVRPRKTRFPLLGSHSRVKCESCHRDPDYKRTPMDCYGCHKADDTHEGQEGTKCESCHDANTWKKARFDHARARFALVGAHLVVPCAKCHATPRYKDAKSECFACHVRDDTHKRRLGTPARPATTRERGRAGTSTMTGRPGSCSMARTASSTAMPATASRCRQKATLPTACISCHLRTTCTTAASESNVKGAT